ncbi:hypothetical protein [Aestuariirhabdus litorea]|uniref:Lipoprotein n=1 Tax=Aestuariirhabdus litorea TaxID=2528527 RepID=A0A3P3VN74_9GAMM|nr:hypothetical protein [Aestuariirhabdus litorea]RRJ83874.1 hypothetical protein D0544_01785 [Aestuariirhabdus litorea]RWW97097.1 hypothetical protein DZC74_01785 [Endozoicomonadaceae bacterium GTF-13]
MLRSHRLFVIICCASLLAGCTLLPPQPTPTLRCQLDGSDDIFLFYPSMKMGESDHYLLYQQLKGLVVAVVDKRSLRFNRLTSLNLTSSPYPATLLSGQCRPQADP